MKTVLLVLLFLSESLTAAGTKFDSGQKIYEQSCISCHGVGGDGNKENSFIVNPRNLNRTILNEEQSYQIIKKGAHFNGSTLDIMPSFESLYDEQELRSVAHYIAIAFNPKSKQRVEELMAKSAQVDPSKKVKMMKRGNKIYKRNCSWCHGLTGNGDGEATRNPDMSIFPYNLNKSLLREEQMFLYAKHGGNFWGAVKEDMPSWTRKYDDYTIRSVIMFIKEELGADK